jgi:hypothetical protein
LASPASIEPWSRLSSEVLQGKMEMSQEQFTVVAAVNSREVLDANLLRSPDLSRTPEHQVLLKEGFASASLAYNSAIEEARHDLMLFVHQDVYLPEGWFCDVRRSIHALERNGASWGVLGAYGARDGLRGVGRIYTTGIGFHGCVIDAPEPIQTLDEITLIIRKSSGLRFDSQLPHFHMYGVDLCLGAKSQGLTNYAIPASCVHNTNQILILPEEFYRCYWYVKRKWAAFLPIHTSCIRISRFDAELRRRKVREFIDPLFPNARVPLRRFDDPRTVLAGDYAAVHCAPGDLSHPGR